MSQSGSIAGRTVGSLGSSSDSGSVNQKKHDFTNRHRKIIRILTVVAYIMSVSVAALLLSAYYVFLWTPDPSEPLPSKRPTDSPSSMAHYGGMTNYPSGGDRYGYTYNRHTSSALQAQYPYESTRSPRVSKKGYQNHKPTGSSIPTPQGLIMEKLGMSSTTTPVRNPASPPDDPDNPTFRKTTPNVILKALVTNSPKNKISNSLNTS